MKLRVKSDPVVLTEDTPPQNNILEVISIEPTAVSQLIQRSREIADESTDYMVSRANTSNLRFNDNAGLTFVSDDGSVHSSSISRFALGQLGTKIGVPARYLEKCVNTGRIDLAQENVNSWLEGYDKDLFLREYRGGIRGVLSSKYSVCDSHEILEAVDDAVDLSKYKVKGSFLNAERLHLRLVSTEMLPIDGEDLFAGLFIDSSDVGRSILTVQFGIYKQVCTNGLVVSRAGGILFQQKHIGITAAEFHSGLVASLQNVDVLTENALEWVRLAQSKDCWGFNVKSLSQDSMDEFIERIRSVARVNSQPLLSEDSAKKVIDLMQNRYGGSRWGLINSLTEVAQDYTLEKRLDIERVAGNLLVA